MQCELRRINSFVSIILTLCVFLSLLPIRELRADLNTHGEYSVPPFEVTYTQNASWDTTTQGAFTVENVSEEAVSSWSFEIEYLYPVTVSNIYGASLVNYSGVPTNTITVVNEASNGNIAAGSSTSFGLMLVGESEAPIAPVSVRLISDNTDTPVIEPTDSVFPYAIFSGSNTSDLTFNGWRSEVVGDVYTGSNYVYNGSELTLNGTVRAVGSITSPGWNINITNQVENAAVENMPDWGNSILARGNELPAIDPIRFTSEDPILTDGYCYIDGDVTISGTTFEGDAIIVASGDITYNINEISGAGRVLLYSENGNITINGTAISVNGILYAPNGRVSISAYNTTLNGRIVANEFFFSGSILDCYANPSDLDMFYPDAEVTITPLPTDEVTITPTEVPGETPTDTPEITDIPEVTVTPSVEGDYYFLDSDGDGLLDYMEGMYGTDPNNPDTDGDGLLDLDETYIGYNPLNRDSDGDGIWDFDEDYDGDGISNGYEYITGTCIFAPDSDYDGVNDYDEVYFYGTDPNNEDSDSDGIIDGDEVTLGLNPGSNDSNGDGITDDYVTFNQSLSMASIEESHPHEITSVEINGYISGLITSNTTISDTYNIDIYCTDVYGRIGVPIEIESSGNFDSMVLTIEYNESLLGETDENNLGVLWHDIETGFFVIQEQAVLDTDNNRIEVELSHFSTYVLVDLEKWNNPILPDYSGYIYQAHGEEIGYWALAYVPSLEEVEASAWAWWHLTNDNMVKLATISSSSEYRGWVVYDFYYDWLVMDATDRDVDGIPDFYERQGILGTNGKIYYLDDNSIDGDTDTLTDKEEIGVIYELVRSLDGRFITVKLNGEVVFTGEYGIIPSSSQYYVLNNYFDGIIPGKSKTICVPFSNPLMPDSDEDGYNDAEDARPLYINPDIVYVFTNPDFYRYARSLANRYQNEGGLTVKFVGFDDIRTFSDAWEGIGLSDDFYLTGDKPYGDRYYYNAKNVVLCTHGYYDRLLISRNDDSNPTYMFTESYSTSVPVFRTSNLVDRRIESLNIYACWCGSSSQGGTNIVDSLFQTRDGVHQIIASDSVLTYMTNNSFIIRGYLDVELCTRDELDSMRNFCSNPNLDDNYYYVNCNYNYASLYRAKGFCLFLESEEPENYYNGDVFIGVMYNYSLTAHTNGVLVYDYRITDRLGNNHFDPVMDARV